MSKMHLKMEEILPKTNLTWKRGFNDNKIIQTLPNINLKMHQKMGKNKWRLLECWSKENERIS